MDDLKPCPFCGNEAQYVSDVGVSYGHGESFDQAGCGCYNCEVYILEGSYRSYQVEERKQNCAAKWNNRA